MFECNAFGLNFSIDTEEYCLIVVGKKTLIKSIAALFCNGSRSSGEYIFSTAEGMEHFIWLFHGDDYYLTLDDIPF